ncbi:Xaa-Pro dipeptidase [Porticoccus sp. W117]|uniref:Xaa-Pro dipeptidase n=1 Tax=Porticoccus sp. W117 TaxID=3054777 RepID=UPI0025940E67|nr:Xaa-Pro dipeptidase [Porticoccus sp. W117]MDM3872419.1 Xaa-Pro dipeptidase [Porticoccus sp. W117]
MLKELYLEHVASKLNTFRTFMAELGIDQLLISSGQVKVQYQDDMFYPFKANVYFKEWLPINRRQDCFLLIAQEGRPTLYLNNAEDIWHTAPQSLPTGWDEPFTVDYFQSHKQLAEKLPLDNTALAYLGEDNEFGLPAERVNPEALRNHVDYQRRFKTAYEHACMREANRLAVSAHEAARKAFMAGESELGIQAAYLADCNCSENEMPYPVIAGLNEHAAILHHHNLFRDAPAQHRSFLIDAGVDVNGYASDITRTYAFDPNSDFAAMVDAMDQKQQELVAASGLGTSGIELHKLSHQKIAEVLVQFDVVNVSADEAVASGLTNTFYPHGIGHGIGVNVHEKGGDLKDPSGGRVSPPEEYPKLRNTTDFVATQVHTVEPGLYFIPALLDKLKGGEQEAKVNWARVEEFIPYGGIRIEDNIVIHADGTLENLTRDAQAALV